MQRPIVLAANLTQHVRDGYLALTVTFPLPLMIGLIAFHPDHRLRKIQVHERPTPVRPQHQLLRDRLDIAHRQPVPYGIDDVILVILALRPRKRTNQVSQFIRTTHDPILSPLMAESIRPTIALCTTQCHCGRYLPDNCARKHSRRDAELSKAKESTALPR